MTQIYDNTGFVYIREPSILRYSNLTLIVKHNTDKIVYLFPVTVEREKTFIRFEVEFPESAPYGQYRYYLTPDIITGEDLDSFDVENTLIKVYEYLTNKGDFLTNKGIYIVNGELCERYLKVLSKGLIYLHGTTSNYKRYEKKRIYTEYDKTRY